MRPALALGMMGLALLAGCTPPEAAPPSRASLATATAIEPHADWSAEMPRLLPGIQVCLAKAGPAVAVTKAWPIAMGLTGARLLQADGKRIDCVATGDGSAVLLTEPVRTASMLLGERDPLFTIGSKAPQSASCVDTAPVEDKAGGDVGWLSYDGCHKPRADKPSAQAEPPRRPAARGGAG
jgi:hypothetical protein